MESDRPHTRTRHPTADAPVSTPDGGWSVAELLTLFGSLCSIAVGIALFTAGDAPTGAPVPLVSIPFVAAGLLFWFGAALGRQPRQTLR
jgi:uncharacterized membrane protein